jgi:hypothetical protein
MERLLPQSLPVYHSPFVVPARQEFAGEQVWVEVGVSTFGAIGEAIGGLSYARYIHYCRRVDLKRRAVGRNQALGLLPKTPDRRSKIPVGSILAGITPE